MRLYKRDPSNGADNVTGQSLSDGRYAFSDLPAGAYAVSAAKDGFEASPVTVVSLPAEKRGRLN